MPLPRHPGGGHARRGTSRQRAHKPCLRTPCRRISPLLTLPQHIYYSTFRPKRKGFSFIIIVFCGGRGKMLFSVKADAFGSAAKQFNQHGGSFPVTIKTKPHGCAMRRGRGGDRKALSSLPQERNPRVTKKFKPHGSAMRRSRGGDRKALWSLPQERNPLRNNKAQLVLTPKSNEIKRNQMKSNFLDEHPFPVLQYHCRNSGE